MRGLQLLLICIIITLPLEFGRPHIYLGASCLFTGLKNKEHIMQKRAFTTAAGLVLTLGLAGCMGSPPETEFGPCPSSPNCVSSKASDEEHIIGNLRLDDVSDWSCLLEQASKLPGEPRIVVQRDDYARIEYTSKTMRFVDDLELKREPDTVQIRSASRLGYRDFGVNRERVMALQAAHKQHCLDSQ